MKPAWFLPTPGTGCHWRLRPNGLGTNRIVEGKANLLAPEISKTTALHRPNAEKLDFAVAFEHRPDVCCQSARRVRSEVVNRMKIVREIALLVVAWACLGAVLAGSTGP